MLPLGVVHPAVVSEGGPSVIAKLQALCVVRQLPFEAHNLRYRTKPHSNPVR